MTAEIKDGVFLVDAGGDSGKRVLQKQENYDVIQSLINEFCNYKLVVKGDFSVEETVEDVTEKVNKFFGEENVIKS
jgi:hypothetical protein